MAEYQARPNSRFSDNDAKIIGGFLEREFKNNPITADLILQKARSKSSPIHKYFDWDDTSAAEKYRRRQAQDMISCVVIVHKGTEVRKYHSVKVDKKAWVNLKTLDETPELWEQVVDRALIEINAWTLKYNQYKELMPIISATKETEKSWQRRKQKQLKSKARKSKSKKRSTSRESILSTAESQ